MEKFNWSKYLRLAETLAEPELNLVSEEAQRSAISRAYYAAYITARNFLREQVATRQHDQDNLGISGLSNHVYLINVFRNSSDNVYQKIGDRLDVLRTLRNQADYDDMVSNLPRKVQDSLTLSRRIISAIERL